MKARALAVALVVALAGSSPVRADPPPAPAAQEDPQRARDLFDQGTQAMQRGRFADAARLLRESLAASKRAATAFNLGVALRGTGDALGALDVFDELASGAFGEIDAARRKEVEELRAETKGDLGAITVAVRGAPEAEVRVDGGEVARVMRGDRIERRVNAGAHKVVVSARDHETVERSVDVVKGGAASIEVELRPAADKRPGHLVLECADAEAQLFIDGQGAGRGKLERDLAPGDYDVRVRTGAGERRARVAVPPGRRVRLVLDAPSRSLVERPLFWVIAGTLVAGGVVAGVVAANASKKEPVSSPVWGLTSAGFRWR